MGSLRSTTNKFFEFFPTFPFPASIVSAGTGHKRGSAGEILRREFARSVTSRGGLDVKRIRHRDLPALPPARAHKRSISLRKSRFGAPWMALSSIFSGNPDANEHQPGEVCFRLTLDALRQHSAKLI